MIRWPLQVITTLTNKHLSFYMRYIPTESQTLKLTFLKVENKTKYS